MHGPQAKKWSKDDAYYVSHMKNVVILVTQLGCLIAMETLDITADVETLFEYRVINLQVHIPRLSAPVLGIYTPPHLVMNKTR